ncbi:unnamed protein product, partial [Polarella glacialis]
ANPDSFKASGPKDSPDSAFAELQTPCRRPTSFRRRSAGQEVTTGSIPDSSGSPQKGKSAGGGAVSSSSRPTTAGEETASAASTFPTSRQSFRSFSWREEWTPGTDQDQSEPTVQKLESMAFPATLPVPAQQQSAHRTSSGQMPGLPPTLPAAAVQARSAASERSLARPPLPPPMPAGGNLAMTGADLQDFSFAMALKRASESHGARCATPPALDRRRWSKMAAEQDSLDYEDTAERAHFPPASPARIRSPAAAPSPTAAELLAASGSFSELAKSFVELGDMA